MSGPVKPLSFSALYLTLLMWVDGSGAVETNERTGHRVKVGRGGVSFNVDLADGLLPLPNLRKMFPKSAAAEVAWFLMGTQSAEFIVRHAPLWDKFVEKMIDPGCDDYRQIDGIKAAYGYRWRKHFGRDQLRRAINTLMKDPSDRRNVVMAWDASQDGLGEVGQRNVPCPIGFTLHVVGDELQSSLFIRSSDLFVGLPYDVMGHALLMDAVAAEMGLSPGVMSVSLAHAHIYEAHWEMLHQGLSQVDAEGEPPRMELPGTPLRLIEMDPEHYVAQVAEMARRVDWPTFSPKPLVVE